MKGIVFTEFLEMVDDRFSPEIADRIIEGCDLPSGGAYTSVGTYEYGELLQLVSALSKETGSPVPGLVREFGRHLFGRLIATHPVLAEGADSSLSFMEGVEGYIHAEVLKLYPEAELPRFETSRVSQDHLELVYRSPRPLSDLAEGLIEGCAAHFGEEVRLERKDLNGGTESHVRFTVTRGKHA